MTTDLPPFTYLRTALSQLENCLNCTYCSRVYADPYTLTTCGHTFCNQCVIIFTSIHNANCPLCHLPNWFNQSQPNRQINALLQHYKQVRSLLGLRKLSSTPNFMKPPVEQKKQRRKKKLEKLFITSITENPIENKLNLIQEKSSAPKDDFISPDAVSNADTISEIAKSHSMVQHENMETTHNSDTYTRPLMHPLETPVQEINNETNTNDTLAQPEFLQLFQAFEPIVPTPIEKVPICSHDVINAEPCSQEININKLTLTNANEDTVDDHIYQRRDEEHFSQSKLTQSPTIDTSQTRNVIPSLTPLFSSQQQNCIISQHSQFVEQVPINVAHSHSQEQQQQQQQQQHPLNTSPLVARVESPSQTTNTQIPHIQANINVPQTKDEDSKPNSPLVEQSTLFSSQMRDSSPLQSPPMGSQASSHICDSQLSQNVKTKDSVFSPQTNQDEKSLYTHKQTHSFTPMHTSSKLFSSQEQNSLSIAQSPTVECIGKFCDITPSQTRDFIPPLSSQQQQQQYIISDCTPFIERVQDHLDIPALPLPIASSYALNNSPFVTRIENLSHSPNAQTSHVQENIDVPQNNAEYNEPNSPLMQLSPLFSSQIRNCSPQAFSHINNSLLSQNATALPINNIPQTGHNFSSSQVPVTEQNAISHSITPIPSKLFISQKQNNPINTQTPIIKESPTIPNKLQQHNTSRMEDSIIIEDDQSLPGNAFPEKTSCLSQPTIETIVLSDDSSDASDCNNSRIDKQPFIACDKNTQITKFTTPFLSSRNRYSHTPLSIERVSHNTSCPIPGFNGPPVSCFFSSSPPKISNSQPLFVKKQAHSADLNFSHFFSKALINQTKDYQLFCTTTPGKRFHPRTNPINAVTPQVFTNIIKFIPPNTHNNLTETKQPTKSPVTVQTSHQEQQQQQQQQQQNCQPKSENTASFAQQGFNSPQNDSTETVGASPISLASPTRRCLNVEQNQSSHCNGSPPEESMHSPYQDKTMELSIPIPSPKLLTADNGDTEMDNTLTTLPIASHNTQLAARDCTMIELIPSQSHSTILSTNGIESPIGEISKSNDGFFASSTLSQNNISTSNLEDPLPPSPADNDSKSADGIRKDVESSNMTPQNSNNETNQLTKPLIISPNQPITTLFTLGSNEISVDHIDKGINTDTLNGIGEFSPLRNFTSSYKDKLYFSPKTPPYYSQFSQMNEVLSVARGLGDKISKLDQIDSDNDSVFSLSQNSPKPNTNTPTTLLNLTPPRITAINHTNSFDTVPSLANGKVHRNERPTSHEAPVISQSTTLTDSYLNGLHTGSFSIIDYADMSIDESLDKSLHFSPSIGSPPTLNPIKRRLHNFKFKKLKLSHHGFTNEHDQSDFQLLRILSPTKNNGNSNIPNEPYESKSKPRFKRRGFQAD